MADVLIYLLHLADILNVDLEAAVDAKMKDNSRRYPPTEPLEAETPGGD